MKTLFKLGIFVVAIGFLFSGCMPAIFEAVRDGNLQKVKKEVESGVNVDLKNAYGWTPLHDASIYGRLDIVEYLVQKGANVNAQSKDNITPLMFASNIDVAKYLVENGADIHAKDCDGETPLFNALNYFRIEIVKYFIENGVDIHVINNYGNNLILFVSDKIQRHNEMLKKYPYLKTSDEYGDMIKNWKFLFDIGVDPYHKNKYDKNAFDMLQGTEPNQVLISYVKAQEQKKEQQKIAKAQEELINKINTMIANQEFEIIKKLTEENPNYVNYIANAELRLMLTGPKGMKVGDILKLQKAGKSEDIIIPLIKRVQVPYKEFNLEEIDILSKMGLNDKIIGAMIDTTTELLKDEKKKKEQEFYLEEQKKIAEQKTQTQVIYQNNNSNNQNQSNDVVDTLKNEAVKQLTNQLFKKLF